MFPQGSAGAGGTFRHFRVLPFGHELRDRLAEKWLMLGGYSRNSAPEFVYRLDQVTRSLDTLIGKNYVPAYPIFVLSVLQAAEAMTPLDTRASTHGYFYELLIKEALARDATEQQYSDAAGYLTHVASAFLVRGLHEADSDEMKTIHRGYEEEYDIQLSFGDMMQHLIDRHILVRYEGAYTFRYRFIYYFFVASHIRDHLHEPVVRETVSKFCRELHGEEQANVLLFLAHLSRDPFIVGEMLKAAKALYPEVPPVQLADDVEFLDNLGDTSDDIIFQDGEVTERRRRLLEAMDSTDAATVVDDTEDGSRDSDENGSAAMSSLNAALKTTQILGQMLKNFPATMKGSVKLELAQTCCSLGLRALGAILSIFRENLSPILADFTAIISERHPDLGEADLRSRARRLMLALSEIACFGFIKHISASVGAPRLAQTYARLVTDGSPPSARLVDTSIALDHSGEFPTGKLKKLAKELEPRFLARRVLQYLTVHHFCVFPVDYKTKMSVCKALGISYKPVRVPRPAQRLVSR